MTVVDEMGAVDEVGAVGAVDETEAFYQAARIPYLLALIIGGNVGLPLILLATWFSRKVIRHPLFTNWFLTWVIFSTVYLLLLYAGEFNNKDPPFSLCLIQAAMIYSADAMIGLSALVLVIYIERVVQRGFISPTREKASGAVLGRGLTIFFVSAPYGIFFLVFLIMIAAGTTNQAAVHRSHFYCTMGLSVKHLGTGLAAVFTGAGVLLLVMTLVRLYRCWRREGRVAHLLAHETGIDLSLILRISLFSAINLLGMVLSLEFISHVTGPVPNILLSLFPVIMTLTFGTSADLRRAYFVCRRSRQTDDDGPGTPVESKVSPV